MKLAKIKLVTGIEKPEDRAGRNGFVEFSAPSYSLTLNEITGLVAIVHPASGKVRLVPAAQCAYLDPAEEDPKPAEKGKGK